MHDFIPIFPCDNTEENGDSLASCGEVGMSAIRGDKTESDSSINVYFTILYILHTACSGL